MNSHIAITGKNPYRDAIWKHLKKHEIKDEYLNVNYNIFAFKARPENVHEYGIIIDILSQFGCEVLDSKVLTKLKFELGLIRQKLISEGVEKIYL